jgi:hypothetical protein
MLATTDSDSGARCERQIKSHQDLFSGRIKQVEQSQQQLLQVINEAVEEKTVESFESKALAITTVAFPNGHWPKDLAPWPSSRISLASIHQAHGRQLEALKYALNGQLLLEHRSGLKWVLHLYNLVQHFSHFLMHPTICPDKEFPSKGQIWDLMYGYLYRLRTCARETLGEETGYAQAIAFWYNDCVENGGAPELINRSFTRRFKQAQVKLLIWAGVEQERAIVLSHLIQGVERTTMMASMAFMASTTKACALVVYHLVKIQFDFSDMSKNNV